MSLISSILIDILIFSLILISLALDGIDGYLSRYLKQMTSFGELFDQEVDNFLILILIFSLIKILTIVFS